MGRCHHRLLSHLFGLSDPAVALSRLSHEDEGFRISSNGVVDNRSPMYTT